MSVYEEERLFFLLGYQKSGTTWLATILDSHPEIRCDGEGHFFPADDRARPYLTNALADSPALRQWASGHANAWTREREFEEEALFYTAAIARAVLLRDADAAGKRLVGDKSGVVGPRSIRSLHRLFPGCRVFHLVRDPRDVAVSKCFHLWRGVADGFLQLPPDEEAIHRDYLDNPNEFAPDRRSIFTAESLRAFAREWAEWVPATRTEGQTLFGPAYLEVTYEGLGERPEVTVASVLAHLDASTDADLVRSCLDEASFERQAGRPRGDLDASSYFRRGVVGDWDNYFTSNYSPEGLP